MLFEKSRVPEINKRPAPEQSDKPEASDIRWRDRRSGSNQKFTVLSNSYLSNLQDAGRRCGCGSGDACAQAPGKARPRRWQQSPDGKWRARRLTFHDIDEQLDEMRRPDDQRVDGSRQEGPLGWTGNVQRRRTARTTGTSGSHAAEITTRRIRWLGTPTSTR